MEKGLYEAVNGERFIAGEFEAGAIRNIKKLQCLIILWKKRKIEQYEKSTDFNIYYNCFAFDFIYSNYLFD